MFLQLMQIDIIGKRIIFVMLLQKLDIYKEI